MENKLQRFAVFSWLVLFPGFFLYHLAIASFDIFPVLGGLFGPYSLLATVVFLVGCLKCRNSYVVSAYQVLVALFMISLIAWTSLHYLLAFESGIGLATRQSAELTVLLTCLYFSARFLPEKVATLRNLFEVFIFAVMLFLVIYVFVTGQLTFDARRWSGVEEISTYQGFARSIAFALLLVVAERDGVFARIILSVAGVVVLFLLGARSEFAAFLIVVGALLLVIGRRNLVKGLLFSAAPLGVGLFVVSLSVLDLANSRQFELLSLDQSSSWAARVAYMEAGLRQVAAHPILGDFGGHVSGDGSVGRYAHNALSAWVNYGVFGFFLYMLLTSWAFVGSVYRVLWLGDSRPGWVLCFLVSVFVTVLVVAAKSVFWPMVALSWGLYVRAVWLDRCSGREAGAVRNRAAVQN